jgi:hypothetical protein
MKLIIKPKPQKPRRKKKVKATRTAKRDQRKG